jgi:branched-chain amino acid transport system permease protein
MPIRRIASALLLLVAALFGGCQDIVDSDRVRICRIAMGALHPNAQNFRIVGTTAPAPDRIDIVYWSSLPQVTSTRQRIACQFEAASVADPRRTALASVAVDGKQIAPAKFWLIKRYYIALDRDPLPFAETKPGPWLPFSVAVGLQQILSGLPQISIYALLAAAYALLYGLIGRINLAFGEFAMLAGYGAFLGFSMSGATHGLAVAALVAAVVCVYTAATHSAFIGAAVFAPLMRAPGQHVLVASVGLALFMQEYMRLAQGTGNRWISPLFNRPLALAHADNFVVTMTPMALVTSLIALTAAALTVFIMRVTRFGRAWRATADDDLAAAMMGIDPRRLVIVTFVFASLLAGLAGFVMVIFYGGVGYAGGTVLGLKALLAAVLGGISSVPGAVLGALLLGLAEVLWSVAFSIDSRDTFIFAALVILLVFRPFGFFGVQRDAPPHRTP